MRLIVASTRKCQTGIRTGLSHRAALCDVPVRPAAPQHGGFKLLTAPVSTAGLTSLLPNGMLFPASTCLAATVLWPPSCGRRGAHAPWWPRGSGSSHVWWDFSWSPWSPSLGSGSGRSLLVSLLRAPSLYNQAWVLEFIALPAAAEMATWVFCIYF